MHRLLRRQLRKHLGGEDEVPAALHPFVAAVDAAYADFDSDRALLERSQELSSKELSEARDKATKAQRRLTDALQTILEGFSLYDADVKQAEQAIQESEQRLRVIAEAAPMAVAIVTFEDGIIRYANQRFSEMFELDGSTALGLRAKTLYADPQHRERFIGALTEHGHVEG